MHSHVHYSSIYNNQDMEITLVPVNEWMNERKIMISLHIDINVDRYIDVKWNTTQP